MPTLNWIGKKAVENHHRQVPFHLLKDVPELSVGDPGTGNLLVEGDNLLALKALLPYYAGQVKCIYIDPPYNTGNENWIYNDNVNSPEINEWLGKTVGKEAEDLCRHDKWLCMMYPRLCLLQQILREDGVIFVSIDDNEVHSLRYLMDEVFGSNNFVANLLWQKKYSSSNDHKSIAPMHDFILVYKKSSAFQRNLLPRTEEKDRQYRFEDTKGIFRISDYTCNKNADERPNLFYPIVNPNNKKEILPKRTRVWAYSKEVYEEHIKKDLIWWGKDGKAKIPAFKRYRDSLRSGGRIVPNTWWSHEFAGHTDASKKEFREILGNSSETDFFTPKPTLLVKRILQIASNPGDLVLDSFAGSGTTGHAVMQLNREDGGNRRFILIEMDTNICRNVTAERLKRVSQGYKKQDGTEVDGLGSGFRFATLGEPLFDEKGRIRDTVRFADLARHVYFTETGEPLAGKDALTRHSSPLLGVHHGTAVYLLYNGILKDKSPDGGNVLTSTVLSILPKHDGPRVIYGTACRIGADRLRREGIVFKQLPYKIRTI